MPRPAATILGFTLVAFSIGFNTARYPMVWEMVGPAQANGLVQPAVTSQSEQPESPPPALPSQPAKPIEVQPASEVAEKTVVDKPASTETKPAGGGDAAAGELEAQKPLVPVTPVGSPSTPGNEGAGGAGIRRLPPIERIDTNPANRNPAVSFDGSIPVYPTTGIE